MEFLYHHKLSWPYQSTQNEFHDNQSRRMCLTKQKISKFLTREYLQAGAELGHAQGLV